MIVLVAALWIVASACMVCLAIYAVLAHGHNSAFLFRAWRGHLSRREQVFLAFAAIGFLTCIFQGTAAMLGWMPESWGGRNESGAFEPLRVSLAALATAGIGFTLIGVIAEATPTAMRERELSERVTHLEKMLIASLDDGHLAFLEEQLSESRAKLSPESTAFQRRAITRDDLRRSTYSDLIRLVQQQRERLRRAPAHAAQR